MWIDIDDAVRICAKMLRARLGLAQPEAGKRLSKRLITYEREDWSGVKAWEAVAAELAPSGKKD